MADLALGLILIGLFFLQDTAVAALLGALMQNRSRREYATRINPLGLAGRRVSP